MSKRDRKRTGKRLYGIKQTAYRIQHLLGMTHAASAYRVNGILALILLSPVYTDMRFLPALTHAISDLNEVQDQIGSIETVCIAF